MYFTSPSSKYSKVFCASILLKVEHDVTASVLHSIQWEHLAMGTPLSGGTEHQRCWDKQDWGAGYLLETRGINEPSFRRPWNDVRLSALNGFVKQIWSSLGSQQLSSESKDKLPPLLLAAAISRCWRRTGAFNLLSARCLSWWLSAQRLSSAGCNCSSVLLLNWVRGFTLTSSTKQLFSFSSLLLITLSVSVYRPFISLIHLLNKTPHHHQDGATAQWKKKPVQSHWMKESQRNHPTLCRSKQR